MEDRFGRKVLNMKGQNMKQRQGIEIPLDRCEDVVCQHKNCGNKHFYTLTQFKKVPAVISPTGQAMVIEVSERYCQKCHEKLLMNNQGEYVKAAAEDQKADGQEQPGEFAATVPEVG